MRLPRSHASSLAAAQPSHRRSRVARPHGKKHVQLFAFVFSV